MTYEVPLKRVVALLAAAVFAAIGAFFVPELGALAAVLFLLGVRDWWARPALVLLDDGFRYVVGIRRDYAAWDLVTAVRVREERHFLAFGRTLEIDLSDDTLIVLSGRQLGAEPDGVAVTVEGAWHQAVRSAPQS